MDSKKNDAKLLIVELQVLLPVPCLFVRVRILNQNWGNTNCQKEEVKVQLLMGLQSIDLSTFNTGLYNFSIDFAVW